MVQSLWSQHGALNHYLPWYISGRVQHISCWFHQVPFTAGWTEAPWDEKFAQHFYTWVLVLPYQPCHQQPCHHQSIKVDFYLATFSQVRLTFTLPPSVRHGWLSLRPSVRHGWLFLVTSSQARLTFPCHQQSGTADFSLSPAVRHGWLFLATSV